MNKKEDKRIVNIVIGSVLLLMACLCIIYGLMVKGIQSGSNFYFVWFAGAILFIVLGMATIFHLWRVVPSPVLKLLSILLGIGLALLLIFEVVVCAYMQKKGEADLPYIIVLGAQVKEDGPSVVLRYRLDTAFDYLMENPDTICIVSGGKGDNENKSESEVMKAYLVQRGIPATRILEENRSTTTLENLRFSKELVGAEQKVGIVTSNFHMFRALQIAKGEAFTNCCGIAAPSKPLFLPNNMFREFFGEVKYILTKIQGK